jgi:hypothetical protein
MNAVEPVAVIVERMMRELDATIRRLSHLG